jgi:HK97 family phage prohead protease
VSNIQLKTVPFSNIKADAAARTVTGIAAVFGNVDSQKDRLQPGAFQNTIANEYEKGRRVRHLWNHSFNNPPTASISSIREIGRDELPAKIREASPDITGGLEVVRKYYDTELSNWIYAAIESGDITEMSFGYEPVRWEMALFNGDDGAAEIEVRDLKEVRLFDTSDVLWGANPETVAAAAKSFPGVALRPIEAVLSDLAMHVKAGRRNANHDERLINAIHSASVGLGSTECKGILTDDDDDDDGDAGKTAGAVDLLKLKIRLAEV